MGLGSGLGLGSQTYQDGLQSLAHTQPCRQVKSGLGPGKDPGDGHVGLGLGLGLGSQTYQDGLQSLAHTQPRRQVKSGLGPGEDPRDGTQRLNATRTALLGAGT